MKPTGKPKMMSNGYVKAPFRWDVYVLLNPDNGWARIIDPVNHHTIWESNISELPIDVIKALERKD